MELCAIRDNITTCDIASITDIVAMIIKLSFKYDLTEADWYFNIDHLMGKVRKKCLYCIQSLFYVMY